MRLAVLLGVTLAVSGCSFFNFNLFGDGDGVSDTPLPFRASLSKGEDARDFTVAVHAGNNSLEAVRETVRFTATRYCLPTYGGSDVNWVIDPATQDWAFTRNGEDMVFSGRCLAR
ncbi:MAG: hypothetical protein HKN27_14505 [Silicimonas sp.]|nr:hypothetical protein [Silicimonas sp.]